MKKAHISSLLVVFLAGSQIIRAQESLDDVFAQLDAAEVSAPIAAEVSTPVVSNESSTLYQEGSAYYRAGDFDKAELVFEAVLAADPYHTRAMTMLKRTAQKISSSEVRKQSASRSVAISEVDKAWNPELKAGGISLSEETDTAKSADDIAIENMTAKLKSIVIPSLDFRDANIQDVVTFLVETSRRSGADQEGINIILLGMGDSMDSAGITISIRDMSLFETLQYIVEMASLKFEVNSNVVSVMPVNYTPASQMVLESFAVIPEVGTELESMAGDDSDDDLFGDSSSSDASGPTDVAGFFSIVEWPDGSSAIYQPNFHKLFVKNTPKNIKDVENILLDLEQTAIMARSQQVEIEAKFVEYNEGALEELGFDWTMYGSGEVANLGLKGSTLQPGSGYTSENALVPSGTIYTDPVSGMQTVSDPTGGTRPGQSIFGGNQRNNGAKTENFGAFSPVVSGILSGMGGTPAAMIIGSDNIDLRITAMEQEGTADVLTAPKVTTKSGNEAIIKVVETHRYPQDYDVETGQRTSPVVKPQDWEDFDLGVVLKVTPVVDSESNTIDLDLEPEIRKFKGFDQYKVGINAYDNSSDTGGTDTLGDGSDLVAKMPYFEVRSVQTQVTIADGSTVLMGGLVDERTETFRDQVPFLGDIPYLGRLFRTEGSRSSKKNLVIYVKATQVDDRGMTRADREAQR